MEIEQRQYQCIAKAMLDFNYVIKNIIAAKSAMRKLDTYANWNTYCTNTSILSRALSIISAAHFPTIIDFRESCIGRSSVKIDSVTQAISDESINPFIKYYNSFNFQFSHSDLLLGISINYFSQLVPGLTLAKILHKRYPKASICIGGSLLAQYAPDWAGFNFVAPFINYIIPFNGEEPFRALASMENPAQIPGILISDGIQFEMSNNFYNLPPISGFYNADFGDYMYDEYYSPKRLLPIHIGEGCYWGRCSFCNYQSLYKYNTIPRKDTQQILDCIDNYKNRYDVQGIFFVDEAMSPSLASNLSKNLVSRNITWYSEIRFDPNFTDSILNDMYMSGCRFLMLGFESGANSVLKKMRKGITTDICINILKRLKKYDIMTHLMFFFGFPSETMENARQTIDFIANNRNLIGYISFGRFTLLNNIPIAQNPSLYGVTIIKEDTIDLAITKKYEVTYGIDSKSASHVVSQFEKLEFVKKYLSPIVISKNHLLFLPPISDDLEQSSTLGPAISAKLYYSDTILRINKDIDILETSHPIWPTFMQNGNKKNIYLYDPVTEKYYVISVALLSIWNYIGSGRKYSELEGVVKFESIGKLRATLEQLSEHRLILF